MNAPAKSTSTLDSARRALRLLKLVGERRVVTLAEVSQELGVGKSTAHRLLMTLLAQDFVERDKAGRRYFAGQAAVAAGLSTLWEFDVRQNLVQPLQRLADSLGETVKLLVLDGPHARVLEVAGTDASLLVGASMGKLLPANSTAGGKMLLSNQSHDSIRHRFRGQLPKITPRTIDDWNYLDVELQTIRRRGWASSEGESTARVNGLAVPVMGDRGILTAALAVAAPEDRLTRTARMDMLGQLVATARQIGWMMGPPRAGQVAPVSDRKTAA